MVHINFKTHLKFLEILPAFCIGL